MAITSRFRRPVSQGWKAGSSIMAPTPARLAGEPAGCPFSRASPAVGRTRPSSIRRVVVLPAPFGPRKPNTWPASTVSSSWFTAALAP